MTLCIYLGINEKRGISLSQTTVSFVYSRLLKGESPEFVSCGLAKQWLYVYIHYTEIILTRGKQKREGETTRMPE